MKACRNQGACSGYSSPSRDDLPAQTTAGAANLQQLAVQQLLAAWGQ
jgi:hypothetical protein